MPLYVWNYTVLQCRFVAEALLSGQSTLHNTGDRLDTMMSGQATADLRCYGQSLSATGPSRDPFPIPHPREARAPRSLNPCQMPQKKSHHADAKTQAKEAHADILATKHWEGAGE
mmetsp:Transcript_101423/g.171701  ORF Transcript_101423/g.171701 Transcript_101423/m.171701 type:complete len:115 (-) Transcript_101423:664-1008(-)